MNVISPISLLQEHVVAKFGSLPVYNFLQQGPIFKCILIVGEIQTSATAINKKTAKQKAAEQALAILYPFYKNSIDHSNNNDAIICNNTDDSNCLTNAVGELNELCSKNGKSYPIYECCRTVDLLFVTQCRLFDYVTEGRAKTKKEAKQLAASDMLIRIKSSDWTAFGNNNELSYSLPIIAEFDNVVTKLCKKLSINKDKHCSAVPSDVSVQKKNNASVKSLEELDLLLESIHDETKVNELLKQWNITYKITQLQKDPLVLCLKTDAKNGHQSYTFLQLGNYYEETKLMLKIKTLKLLGIIRI